MPIVVTCPTCQQKARVPEAMLGKSVKCPECGATFMVPADGLPPPVSPPPTVESAPPEPPSRPLPADADSLRAVRSGAGVQLIAHCLYAAALGAFILLYLVSVSGALAIGSGFGGRGTYGSAIPTVLTIGGAMLLIVAGLFNIVAGSISVLAPPAHVTRGLAIAALVLAVLSFLEVVSTSGRVFFFIDDMPGRYGESAVGPQVWLAGIVTLWVVEITRLSVLALFWRAMSRILRDGRGATQARRLAIAGPVVQTFLVFAWIVIGILGAAGQEVAILGILGWLAVQFFVVLAGVGVVARLWRRLKALVSAGA